MDNHILIAGGWLLSGFIGAICGSNKGSTGWGLVYGLLLGPLGWILLMLKDEGASTGSYFGTLGLVVLFLAIIAADGMRESISVQKQLQELEEKLGFFRNSTPPAISVNVAPQPADGNHPAVASRPSQALTPGIGASAKNAQPLVVEKSQIVVACGKVVAVGPEGILMDGVNPLAQLNGVAGGNYLTDPEGEGARNVVRGITEKVGRDYGQLMVLERGFLHPASYDPEQYAAGRVLLVGLPEGVRVSPQSGFRVLAVPLGPKAAMQGRTYPTYTIDFQLPAQSGGSWMQDRDGSLERGAYRKR